MRKRKTVPAFGGAGLFISVLPHMTVIGGRINSRLLMLKVVTARHTCVDGLTAKYPALFRKLE
ncbi:MAG: hypothetical protein ACLP05_04430 [Candidatus Kryptoniota bacterium]